jgi:phosphatidylserine/phosphatidylglycerophosphate/cardiolipin synthase-like enzyme
MAKKRRTTTRRTRRRSGSVTAIGLIALVALITLGFLISRGYIDVAALLRRAGIDPAVILPATPGPAVVEELADGTIEVFFTTPELVYPDLPRDRIPPAHERALLADIETATRSIELASFEYNLSSVAEALARAQGRGVAVRLALDREVLENPVAAKWAGIVEDAGIPVSWEESDGFLHSKFVVVDDRVVWMGSWNVTINDTYRNNNNLLRITVPPIVENYAAEFERMAGGAFGNSKGGQTPHPLVRLADARIENYFSPTERISSRIVDWIDRARVRVDVLAFSFTANDVGDALIARQQAAVPVRVVFEARNAEGAGSEYARLQRYGLDVLEDGNCYTMHHKVIIIDERVVITGSYNFTGRAEDVNDENLIIIDSPAVAQAYMAEFERVYRQAQSPTRCE